MTVKDLINLLQCFPLGAEVEVGYSDERGTGSEAVTRVLTITRFNLSEPYPMPRIILLDKSTESFYSI